MEASAKIGVESLEPKLLQCKARGKQANDGIAPGIEVPEVNAVRKDDQDPVPSMKQTAQNLAQQAKQLRDQARDLSQESKRIRRVSKKLRESRRGKRQSKT